MTRILVQRGLAGSSSSSNQNRSSASSPSSSSTSPQHQGTGTAQVVPAVKDEDSVEVQELDELSDNCAVSENKSEDISLGSLQEVEKSVEDETVHNEDNDDEGSGNFVKEVGGLSVMEGETDAMVGSSTQKYPGSSSPPPPPVPPPKPSFGNLISRIPTSSDQNLLRTGPSGRASVLPGVRIWSSPTRPCPSSPRSHFDVEGYNSADEQNACFSSSYTNAEREHQFEIDIRRAKGLEVRKMLEDGNCLFRGVADQVYGDSELYDLVRQMCIDYMERERDHFSQFITEGFTSYCKRKRRDKVYGNNVEIQALSEMYNRPIHIYSYSPEPINIFHGNYHTDPPIRLSYHHGNHYNSLVDPRRPTVGAGLGFSSLHGTSIDKEKVKAVIKAQQDQHIDNALLAEGRFFSDLELTEKEIERMVMETSRAEYLANDKFMQHPSPKESSTSSAEPSSSATRTDAHGLGYSGGSVLSDSMQVMLSMGFSYLQVVEACSIFGDDVDSMACYLIETSSSARNKGKATEKNAQPRFQFIVMNRRNTDNLVENLLGDFEYEVQVPYLLYRNASQEVNGIWFYNARECKEVANLFTRILNAYSRVPTKSKLSSVKSEFEELEAVPTLAVMDGPLEPTSTTANAADVSDDPSFINFFSNARNIGGTPNTVISGQPFNPPATVISTPNLQDFSLPALTTPQPPSNLSASISIMSILENAERTTSTSQSSADLVKPSSFFGPPPSSAPLVMPPISSATPTAPPLNTLANIQRPYGAPLLQPFPPPAPPPSLTPTPPVATPNYGPPISTQKVRDALQSLVQDNQFIDMVYQAMLNAHQS